jgi:acetyl esterase
MDTTMPNGPKFAEWNDAVMTTEIIMKGNNYVKGAADFVPAIIHRPRNLPKNKSPCMIYYHGGGGFAGSARGYLTIVNRYALEGEMVVLNVDYRLAPEHKAPLGVLDAYAAVKFAHQYADDLGIDKTRIGIMGDSGGGYITTAVGMILAQTNESHLVRFQLPLIPQTSNVFLREKKDYFTPMEQTMIRPM